MHVFAVAEPELMHAARVRSGAVEERNRFRIFRLGNVEQLEARGLQILLRGLIGDRHQVAAGLQRVRAHVGVRQIGLADHLGLARIGHVDRGEILRRALMRQPDDAPSVGRDLHRHALAHAAEAAEHVVRQKLEIPDDGLIAVVSGLFSVAAIRASPATLLSILHPQPTPRGLSRTGMARTSPAMTIHCCYDFNAGRRDMGHWRFRAMS